MKDEGQKRLLESLRQLTGEPWAGLDPLGGGRNSRVWRAFSPVGRVAAVKQYFRSPADPRDRLGVEWQALRFVHKYLPSRVPAPWAIDEAQGLAVYEFIAGQAPAGHQGLAEDIAPLIDFLSELLRLGLKPEASGLPEASEALFDLENFADRIKTRLDRLTDFSGPPELNSRLKIFLETRLKPELDHCLTLGGPGSSLPSRILSPSDFGFHNAVRRPSGELVFIDFEYFGWDDPAKLIIDTWLHPHEHMTLSPDQQRKWLEAAVGLYGRQDPGLPERLRLLAPWLRLKWSLILLNEFVKNEAGRRAFSGRSLDPAGLETQLRRAEIMLDNKIEVS